MKHIKTTFNEFILEGKITLSEIFDDYPEEDEHIWNYVGSMDFDHAQYTIRTINISDIITPEFIENFKENAEEWQIKYVEILMKNIDSIKDKPIVYDFHDKIVVDGNHKLMAMYLLDLKKVNVIDIMEEE